MKTILSTKKLSASQKALILNSGFSFVDYDAIAIELLNFKVPSQVKNAIFTSQNSVLSLLKNSSQKPDFETIFCVGEKTKALLEENGLKVTNIEENASKLAQFIAKNYKNEQFYFFCGNLKMETLGMLINASKNSLIEIKTYKTTLKTRVFDQNWDGIMFFSPSGVQSFIAENSIGNSIAFCIGETTATEGKKYTDRVFISNTTSVESVIAKTIKILKES